MNSLPAAALSLVAAFSVDASLHAAARTSRGMLALLSAPDVSQWRSLLCEHCDALYQPRNNGPEACHYHSGFLASLHTSDAIVDKWSCCDVMTTDRDADWPASRDRVRHAPPCQKGPHTQLLPTVFHPPPGSEAPPAPPAGRTGKCTVS